MALVAYDRSRRRVWLCSRRCHHGLVGVALIAAGTAIPGPVGHALVGLGAALALHDWPDRWWVPARAA